MSWSIGRIHGRPAKVQKLVEIAIESTKKWAAGFPQAEQESIDLAAKQISGALKFCVAQGCPAVAVEADGSATTASTNGAYPGAISVSVKVEPFWGFAE